MFCNHYVAKFAALQFAKICLPYCHHLKQDKILYKPNSSIIINWFYSYIYNLLCSIPSSCQLQPLHSWLYHHSSHQLHQDSIQALVKFKGKLLKLFKKINKSGVVLRFFSAWKSHVPHQPDNPSLALLSLSSPL